MDFFERQQAARRQARWVLFLFVGAVAIVALAVDALASMVYVALWMGYGERFPEIHVSTAFHATVLTVTCAMVLFITLNDSWSCATAAAASSRT